MSQIQCDIPLYKHAIYRNREVYLLKEGAEHYSVLIVTKEALPPGFLIAMIHNEPDQYRGYISKNDKKLKRNIKINKRGIYKGFEVIVRSKDDKYYYVIADTGKQMPFDFMLDMIQIDPTVYSGHIRIGDAELRIVNEKKPE